MLLLTLIRHAKAEPARHGQEDWERALDPRGVRDAPEMARRLKSAAGKPDKVLASPAQRAMTTATLIARELGIHPSHIVQDERLYLASPKVMLSVVHELGGDVRHLAIVGHNPGITEFGDQLSAERSLDNMPTCAIYRVEFEIERWSELVWGSGVNASLDYPGKLA